MHINRNFEITEVSGEYIAVPLGIEAVTFHGVVILSEPVAYLLKQSLNDFQTSDWVGLLLEEYEISGEVAEREVNLIIPKLIDLHLIENN